MKFTFIPHALKQMERRKIPKAVVELVLEKPDEVVSNQDGRRAYHGSFERNGKTYLLRAIIEDETTVVTVYFTSKVKKYRSDPE